MKRRLFLVSIAIFGALPSIVLAQAPTITAILIKKQKRRLYLFSGKEMVKSYHIDLGFSPLGHKQIHGDGKTPEGRYYIDRKNGNSKYHLSVGISYPNAQDRQKARELGKHPGGDIFIHGTDSPFRWLSQDWTAGCIAVRNRDIEEIFNWVKIGTPVFIQP